MAKKDAIALIVAGSGEMTKNEVFDLLEDAYPLDGYEEVGLIFPTDKGLFTKTVEHVLAWHDVEDSQYPVHTKGASYSRTSSKFGDNEQEVESWLDNLTPEEFKDWDQVHFLLAMPDPDAEDYDQYAEMAEVAIDNGLTVLNLASGLDDVVLEDEPEPEPEKEPEPEPEPEKPTRRRGRARQEAEEEPEEPARRSRGRRETPAEAPAEEPAAEDTQEDPAEPETATSAASDTLEDQVSQAFLAAMDADSLGRVYNALSDVIGGLRAIQGEIDLAMLPAREKVNPTPPEEEEPKPTRGRGRPRTNFEVKQVLDEDTDEWVPRPKGRLRKGTEYRSIHAETGEVLESGTV